MEPDAPSRCAHARAHARAVVPRRAATGRTLWDELRQGGRAVPNPRTVVAVVDAIAAADPRGLVPRPSVLDDAPAHAGMVQALLPTATPRLQRLLAAIGPEGGDRKLPVHGDLRPAQLLVADGRLVGAVDVDQVGLGHPIDDLARFLGHLDVLSSEHPIPDLLRYTAVTLVEFERAVDVDELHRRVAAVILSLASGPFGVSPRRRPRACLRRLALAERWASGDVKDLITPS